jgi:signal peptidase I
MLDLTIRGVRLAGRFVLRAVVASSVLFFLAVGVGPASGRYRTVTVLTGSMSPGMPPGSLAVLVPVDPATVRVGDVITFEAPVADRPVVTHRVIEVVEGGDRPALRTQGDANDAPDPWTAQFSSGPIWKRVAVVPTIGRAIQTLRSPLVHRVTVQAVPILLLVVLLVGIWSRDDHDEDRPVMTPAAAGDP